MIKINRTDCPISLNKCDEKFRKNDYKKEDVRETLLEMQYRKCCYCEVKLTNLGYKEIDHYIPKTADDFKDASGKTKWYEANRWTNLLYACKNCNSAKHGDHPFDKETGERKLIDPSCEDLDPEEHIDFILEEDFMVHNICGKTKLGQTTGKILKFDSRTEFFGWFKKIRLDIDNCFMHFTKALIDEDSTEILSRKNDIRKLMSAHKPFAAFSRALVVKRLTKLNENTLPRIKERYGIAIETIIIHSLRGAEKIT